MVDNKENLIRNLEQTLKEEAEQYFHIRKECRRENWIRQREENYFINRSWLKKWKDYVDYKFIKNSIQYSYNYSRYTTNLYDPKPDFFPGEIDNSFFLESLQNFLNDGDIEDPENFVIRHNVNLKQDFHIVNLITWEFLYTRYGGGPEIRKRTIEERNRYSSSYKRIVVDAFYKRVNLITFPKRIDLSEESLKLIKEYTVYISKAKSMTDLKLKYMKLVKNLGETFYIGEVEPKNLRLWKINQNLGPNISLGAEKRLNIFSGMLKESLNDKLEEIRDNKHEFYSGNFYYMEYIENIKLEDVDFNDSDVLFFEYSTDISPNLFKVKEQEGRDGTCEWCRSKTFLQCFCSCKSVWYCSENCKDRNKSFHKGSCNNEK
jgi:hypothetical protein